MKSLKIGYGRNVGTNSIARVQSVYTSHSGECHHVQYKTVTSFPAFIAVDDQMMVFSGFESQTK
jgi:hypothetical protein